jgi:hypothetical protein
MRCEALINWVSDEPTGGAIRGDRSDRGVPSQRLVRRRATVQCGLVRFWYFPRSSHRLRLCILQIDASTWWLIRLLKRRRHCWRSHVENSWQKLFRVRYLESDTRSSQMVGVQRDTAADGSSASTLNNQHINSRILVNGELRSCPRSSVSVNCDETTVIAAFLDRLLMLRSFKIAAFAEGPTYLNLRSISRNSWQFRKHFTRDSLYRYP